MPVYVQIVVFWLVLYIDTNISEEHAPSIIRVEMTTLKMETVCFSETLAAT
jgi:hypothetical protein